MGNIGFPEIAIVLVIVLVIFGPKRLPDLGRSLGRGMREFKDSVTGNESEEPTAIEAGPDTTPPAAEVKVAEPAGAGGEPESVEPPRDRAG